MAVAKEIDTGCIFSNTPYSKPQEMAYNMFDKYSSPSFLRISRINFESHTSKLFKFSHTCGTEASMDAHNDALSCSWPRHPYIICPLSAPNCACWDTSFWVALMSFSSFIGLKCTGSCGWSCSESCTAT